MKIEKEIIDLLKKNDEISITEITEKLKIEDRKEVTKVLQNLKNQGTIYRNLKEGKAYYSLNNEKGEGKNASQKSIDLIQMVLDNIGNQGKSIEELTSEEGDINASEIKFKYTENLKYENDEYKMLIPDSFEIEEETGRDFTAYLYNPKKEDLDLAFITIYSSIRRPYEDEEQEKGIQEVKSAIYDYSFWTSAYQMHKLMGGNPIYTSVNLNSGRASLTIEEIDSFYNFYFVCFMKKAIKQIRIVIKDVKGTLEELTNIAIQIMNGISLKENVNPFKDLNDTKFMSKKLTSKGITEWVNIMKEINTNLETHFKVAAYADVEKTKIMQAEERYKESDLEKDIRNRIKENISIFEKYFMQAKEFIEKARENNIDNIMMLPAYKELKDFYNANSKKEFSAGEDFKIVEESEEAKRIYKEIFNKEIENLIKDYKENNIKTTNAKELNLLCKNLIEEKTDILNNIIQEWDKIRVEKRRVARMTRRVIFTGAMEYETKYNNLILALDESAKALLKQGADYKFIKKVIKLLDEIFDAIRDLEKYVVYSAYKGSMKDVRYPISSKANTIKNWWKKQYEKCPEVIEQRKEQEEKLRIEKEAKIAEHNNIAKILKDNIDEEYKKWEKEIKEIDGIKEKYIKEYTEKEKAKKPEDIEELLEKQKQQEMEREQLFSENKNLQEEISKLTIFNFLRKDTLQNQLISNEQKILEYNGEIARIVEKLETEKREFLRIQKENIGNYKKEIEDKYIYPKNPKEILADFEKEEGLNTYSFIKDKLLKSKDEDILFEADRRIIYKEMRALRKDFTIKDIIEKKSDNISEMRIMQIIQSLIDEKILKIVKGE